MGSPALPAWVIYSLATLIGNFAVAVTGLGMAIFFTFIYQIATLSGFRDRDFKFMVFMQSLALLVAQPVLLHNADVMKHAVRPLMVLFIPATLVSTPLGQIVAEEVDVAVIQSVGGVLVLAIGLRELHRSRGFLEALFCGAEAHNDADVVAKTKALEPRRSPDPEADLQLPSSQLLLRQGMVPRLSEWTVSALHAFRRGTDVSVLSSGSHTRGCSFSSFVGGEDTGVFDEDAHVFFMIGSQRSGSNWLRTMLNEREDLAGPHPPHILREFQPILAKFGDIDQAVNAKVLIDHVLLFVERNQVMWKNQHGRRIRFDRTNAFDHVLGKMTELREHQVDLSGDLDGIYILISLLDYCYSSYAQQNDKRTYMCKSMGMSKYHLQLLEYFGENRLRYVYLVRDPRDVALSFTKTPVGDCHYYPIITKWCRLQDQVIPIMQTTPELVHRVSYEGLLRDKEAVMAALNEFMGQRSFGKTLRRGSVLELTGVDELLANAKKGNAARDASTLSYQFKNLTRGESLCKTQFQKWRSEISSDDLYMLESLAGTTMVKLGYFPVTLLRPGVEPAVYTEEQVSEFLALNRQMVDSMNVKLAVEDPLDAARRAFQNEVLGLDPVSVDPVVRKAPYPADSTPTERAVGHPTEVAQTTLSAGPPRPSDQLKYPFDWPAKAEKVGYLSPEEITAGTEAKDGEFFLSDGRLVKWAANCQRGYYPSQSTKPNQDSILLVPNGVGEGTAFFGVYDGHGPAGDLCSQHARDQVPKNFWAARPERASAAAANSDALHKAGDAVQTALERAHTEADGTMEVEAAIDDSKSGTTATSLFIDGLELYVANIGDSKCLLVETDFDSPDEVVVTSLSAEHNLYVASERDRIKEYGGKVMTTAQLEGSEPAHEAWTEGGEPPRVWAGDGTKAPGTAFSRSMGDRGAAVLGVIAEPEVERCIVSDGVEKILLMSDGVTEFISDKEIATVARLFPDPAEGCRALVGESYKRWMKQDDRSDDISIIILSIEAPPHREQIKFEGVAPLERTNPTIVTSSASCEMSDGGVYKRTSSYLQSMSLPVRKNCEVTGASPIMTPTNFKDGGREAGVDGVLGEAPWRPWPEHTEPTNAFKLTTPQVLFTLGMGFLSGFLGGLCGIRGPPMIIFFMHCPIELSNHQQRATSTAVTLCNVLMRVVYYAVKSAIDPGHNKFDNTDWDIYTSVGASAVCASWLGERFFKRKLAHKKDAIKALLSVPLVVCGITLLITAIA